MVMASIGTNVSIIVDKEIPVLCLSNSIIEEGSQTQTYHEIHVQAQGLWCVSATVAPLLPQTPCCLCCSHSATRWRYNCNDDYNDDDNKDDDVGVGTLPLDLLQPEPGRG